MNKQIINNVLATDSNTGSLILRVTLGVIFIAHGAQKLFGWFGGYGLEATGQWMASVGLEPGFLMALAAGLVEFGGGVALIFGVLTRLSALALAGAMAIALFAVHLPNGFFMATNGYEFALALLAASISLVFTGAGRASLDGIIVKRLANGESQTVSNSTVEA